MANVYDYVVVGAGACGTVIASKLARALPTKQILLLEAGKENRTKNMSDAMRRPNPMALWGDPTITFDDLNVKRSTCSAARSYPVGKIVGGGSAINGMGAIRGHPDDFKEWEIAYGCGEDWGWERVLNAYKAMETDPLSSDRHDIHGNAGPLPIHRIPYEAWGPVSKCMRDALCLGENAAMIWSYDLNDPESTGVSPFPMNMELQEDGTLRRVSTNDGYLDPAREACGNMTVLPNSLVDKVIFNSETSRATGVQLHDGTRYFAAVEVVLCAGALYSPSILQRSGVGPKALLDKFNIPVIKDCGVGVGLQDHPVINGKMILKTNDQVMDEVDGSARHANALARFTSNIGGFELNDLYFVSVEQGNDPRAQVQADKDEANSLQTPVGYIDVMLMKCKSRGSVELGSTDPTVSPIVNENMLSDPLDLARMRFGVRKLIELFQSPRMEELVAANDSTGKLMIELGRANDGLSLPLDEVSNMTDEELNRWMQQTLSDGIHVSCSIPMGVDQDSCVDTDGFVFGFDRSLRVADASIMPSVPRANTHLTAIAIAEIISNKMIADVVSKSQQAEARVSICRLHTLSGNEASQRVAGWILDEWPSENKQGSDRVGHTTSLGNQLLQNDRETELSVLNESFSATWVALHGAEIMGTVRICSHDMEGRDDEFSPWLAALFVPKEHRAQKVGRKLVTHVVQEYFDHCHSKPLHLWFPTSKQERLLPFYLSCGFIPVRTCMYNRSSFGEEVTIMRLNRPHEGEVVR